MRLVFVLYAEDRDLLSSDPVYANFYSVTGPVRAAADRRRPLHRHDGPALRGLGATAHPLPHDLRGRPPRRPADSARKGYLFDPDRYNFLEGRAWKTPRRLDESRDPHVSDGVVYRVLQNLLILDGERLSYRSLDVEQIGSVYETMMGFNLRVAEGRSIAIKPTKSARCPGHDQPGSPAGRQTGRPGQVARRTDRPESDGPGRRRAEEGGHPGRPAGRAGEEDRLARHAQRGTQRRR